MAEAVADHANGGAVTGAIELPNNEPLVDRKLVFGCVMWAMVWVTYGPWMGWIASMKFTWPGFLADWFATSYGPVRIAHTNGVALGWFSVAVFGWVHYMVPKLCGRPIWSRKLSYAALWFWNIGLCLAFLSYHTGNVFGMQDIWGGNQGFEFAEAPLLASAVIGVGFICMTLNLFMTIATRKERKIYVSLWYLMAGFTWSLVNYCVGNFLSMAPSITGANNAALNGYYLHNVVGLWVTPMGVGMAYYLLPVTTKNPLYSHKLSLIGFWTLAFFYPFTGAHHYLMSPIPDWVETIAIISSMMLLVPVWSVIANFWGTMRGKWHLMADSVIVRFLIVGAVYYLTTCFQGPTQALRALQPIIHFTDYVVGHAHLALFGTFSIWMMAALYYIVPRVYGRELYSVGLAKAHFWLVFMGFLIMALVLWAAGIIQGHMLLNNVDWPDTVQTNYFYWIARTVGGTLMDVGMVIFAYNIIQTIRKGTPSQDPALV
ncbi:MAG: cbb3-type cytochrome c oxidase subunit I [Planctomycetes bacterium]|nr:cbb3-type cytochrome c oxidase subunit I [Planctomycetota bacterium]